MVPCLASSQNVYKTTFIYNAGKTSVDASLTSNARAFDELDGVSARLEGRKLDKVEIRTFSSPEGNVSWNTRLSSLRSSSVKQIISQKFGDSVLVEEVLVPEDWDSAVQYLNQTSKPWKDEALQIIRSRDDNVKNRIADLWAGEAWDDLIWNCFSRVRRSEVIFHLTPDSEISEGNSSQEAGILPIHFAVGRTAVNRNTMDNAVNMQKLRSMVASRGEGEKIVLNAFSSPEGRESWNLVLARRRAESVKNYLVSLGVPADCIEVNTVQEDWSGLAEVVKENWLGSDRSEIEALINDGGLGSAERESKLRSISAGAVWNTLIRDWMSGLRRVDISFANGCSS